LPSFWAGIIAVRQHGLYNQYAKNNTPLLVKIYPKSNKLKNSFAGIYIRLGKICIFLLPSLAGKPH